MSSLAGIAACGCLAGTAEADAGRTAPPPPAPEKSPLPPAPGKPSIKLDKSKGQLTSDKDGDSEISPDDVLTYKYKVTNDGKVRLRKIRVTDDKIENVSCKRTRLKPGGETTCTGTYTVTDSDAFDGKVTNRATATGTAPTGRRVRDKDTASTTMPVLRPG